MNFWYRFKFLKISLYWLKKGIFIGKTSHKEVRSLLKLLFDLNQALKIVLTNMFNSEYFPNSIALCLYQKFKKDFKVMKSVKETRISVEKKFTYAENPEQNIANKVKKSSKTGQQQKPLISIFCKPWQLILKLYFWKVDYDFCSSKEWSPNTFDRIWQIIFDMFWQTSCSRRGMSNNGPWRYNIKG